ncbi:hypothetical protein Tco_1580513, partial [Tanacetum coccineum]
GPVDELSPWATEKMRKIMQKSINWVVVGIETGKVYEVDDHRRVETIVSKARVYEVDDHRSEKMVYENSSYQELVYPVGEVSSWQIPNNLPVVKPPVMSKRAGRPKSTKRIRSQGEEPVKVRCGRYGQSRSDKEVRRCEDASLTD